jgi:crotonobetainyl-CoA:carnitine CoA-transferase CaiB-like acyl-CoA transferase
MRATDKTGNRHEQDQSRHSHGPLWKVGMSRPFADLRVLDFTTTIAGPYCARLFADAGADVIKIEAPEGELTRHRPPLRHGASTSYGQLNAGKRSLVLNLKEPGAVEIIHRLVATADVVVENFRPGVMARFGLDYPALSAINPRLIYCAISGYGQTGPSSELAAYAPAIHAASGYDLAHLVYQEGRERPDNCGIYTADILSGTYAYGAIATALVQRHTTCLGQMIDVSMLESMLNLTTTEVQLAQFPQPPAGKPLFGPVATRNGYIMPAIASERTFQNLAKAAGREDWITDPRFAEYPVRRGNWGALIDELELWSRTLTTAECEAAMNRHGVPCSAYRSVSEALADPQLAHRDALAEVFDAGGSFRVVNAPYRMSAGLTKVREFSADLGQHSREVLHDAGYSDAAIDEFIARGAVSTA